MPTNFRPEHSFQALGPFFSRPVAPSPVREPQWIAFNQTLAEQLQLPADLHATKTGLNVWSGNKVPSWAQPIALAYAGHQFGNLVPQLGDGRALLLAEAIDKQGKRWDIQLKGAGPTEFSRGGDGRSAIGPVLREYLLSESMFVLGVPTTRALAAVASGELVFRDQGGVPGAVFTRVASSHLRIGSFQFASLHGGNNGGSNGGADKVKQLADYAIARHYPELADTTGTERYLAFLHAVAMKQAELVSQWLRVGFIHGVMNTDNTSICGETIDYGPAACLDGYHPQKVFSSIDRRGRYAFRNQTGIAQWNLARLAECLLPLLTTESENDDEAQVKAAREEAIALATRVLDEFAEHAQALWIGTMGAKLGIEQPTTNDSALIDDFLALLQEDEIDYTQAFWQLANELTDSSGSLVSEKSASAESAFVDPTAPAASLFARPDGYLAWRQRWLQRIGENQRAVKHTIDAMRSVNPALIPRNHRIAEAITEVEESGSLKHFYTLLNAWKTPYNMPTSELELELYQAPSKAEEVQRTFCGT